MSQTANMEDMTQFGSGCGNSGFPGSQDTTPDTLPPPLPPPPLVMQRSYSIAEKDAAVAALRAEKDAAVAKLRAEVASAMAKIADKDIEIKDLHDHLAEKNETITGLKEELAMVRPSPRFPGLGGPKGQYVSTVAVGACSDACVGGTGAGRCDFHNECTGVCPDACSVDPGTGLCVQHGKTHGETHGEAPKAKRARHN
jgi:hypothetical protein